MSDADRGGDVCLACSARQEMIAQVQVYAWGKISAGWHCIADLISMELSFDILQNLVAFDAWETLGSFQYVSVQLRYTSRGSHAPRAKFWGCVRSL